MKKMKKLNRAKLVVDEEFIIALSNLITVTEEMYDSRRHIDADDVIAAQSVGTAKEFIERYNREMKRRTFNKN